MASLDFVMEGIEKTLEEVPKEKVINALPFYVRFWTVDDSGAILDVQALPMSKGNETVAAAGATAEWDDATGQNYAEWTETGQRTRYGLKMRSRFRQSLK